MTNITYPLTLTTTEELKEHGVALKDSQVIERFILVSPTIGYDGRVNAWYLWFKDPVSFIKAAKWSPSSFMYKDANALAKHLKYITHQIVTEDDLLVFIDWLMENGYV